MIVGVPREQKKGERRVALTPSAAAPLIKLGIEIRVETDAGTAAGFRDADYSSKGIKIVSRSEALNASVLFTVDPPKVQELKKDQVVIGFADPLTNHARVREFSDAGITLFAVELVPRITRAQSMDALSSQANLAGYQAVLWSATRLPKIFPMMTTAAGSIKPAKALILGAGVAGLQAIATARRLGAAVFAFDVRPIVKEQVQSLGARFVELPLESAEGQGGYAKEQSADQQRKQQELLAKTIADMDVVISTAAIPGKRSPILITKAAVEAMRPGSVIVDLAAERGGNCELTQADEIIEHNGVTIYGPTNLPSSVPQDASTTYSNNLVKLLQLMMTKEGQLLADITDEVAVGCLVCRNQQIVHPMVRSAMGLPALEPARQSA
jgi:NAD(P) transhydrogenase subunit alpha